ncbi:MAG: tol-pal system protein YbgF [Betaproteobacteria bacterium]|nr:MAG: tol-pal system protein YbgF [Betaproteobacteria bacterium]
MCLRVLLLLAVLVGCNSSYAALFDDKGARQQIVTQQKQIDELRKQGKVLETHITKLEETNNQALVRLHNQIEELKIALNNLNGQIEVLTNEIGLSQNRQKDFYIDLDSRLRRIEQLGASADPELNAKPSSATGGLPTKNVTVGAADESRDYEAAFDLFKIGKYQDAISMFKGFIKSHPESKLIPSAHYWIGNSYYALRDFNSAIDAQRELIKAFPDSAKVPDAMLNIASSQQEINHRTDAKETLNDLIAQYPISDAAEKAKLRLANQK